MLKINIFCVGTLKENYLKEAINEYKKRLSKYLILNIIEVKEAKIKSFDNESLIKKTLDEEGERIIKLLKSEDYLILVDLHGKEETSEEFANDLRKLKDYGKSSISFVIGGTLGLSDKLRKIANLRISLSKMTFPHQLTRVILLEQIYRAFKIINNESYHH
mgnify:FL=1